MARVVLVLVMGGFILEDQVERDIPLPIIDFPGELLCQYAGGKVDGSLMAGKVLLASLHQLRAVGRSAVFQREVNHVTNHEWLFIQVDSDGINVVYWGERGSC